MTDLNKEQVISRLAGQIHNPTPDTNQLPEAYLTFAKVISVASFRASIQLTGSSTTIPGVRYLSAVSFAANDIVAVIQYKVGGEETAYLILGTLA